MAYIHIDLREFDTDDLIEELENRYLSDNEKQKLAEYLATDNCQKLAFILKVYNKYSLLELQEMFKDDICATPSKNQILLPFQE